jgi:uncharacterized membrane protein
MEPEKSPERLVFFSDAVVAIALTLLVLPLAEAVPELVARHGRPIEAITENRWQIFSFLLSFAVIARQWTGHHRLFEQVRAYSGPLLAVNLGWLLTIAVLPFPTELIGGFADEKFTMLFYTGTILASSLCQTVMLLLIRRDHGIAKYPGGITDSWRLDAVGSTIALAVAFVLIALVPAVGYYAILLVAVPPMIARIRYGRPGQDGE